MSESFIYKLANLRVMTQHTVFEGAIGFFQRLGIYDVVLPFLLVFTIVFAIFERTKILGTEGGKSKKNLNAVAAFSISLMVVVSSESVRIINESTANIVLLLLMLVGFLLLVGTFHEEGKAFSLNEGWKSGFMWAMLVGVLLVFLDATQWLDEVLRWFRVTGGDVVGSIILIILIVAFIGFITQEGSSESKK